VREGPVGNERAWPLFLSLFVSVPCLAARQSCTLFLTWSEKSTPSRVKAGSLILFRRLLPECFSREGRSRLPRGFLFGKPEPFD